MMLKKATLLLFFFAFIGTFSSYAQHIAINNNLLFDMTGALSLGVEIPSSRMSSFDVYGSIRPWKRGNESVHKHWSVQAQYRIWTCQVMNGFFYGPYVHFCDFNIANYELPFGLLKGLKPDRFEGWLAGGGIGAGYEYALAKHWNVGAEVGVGYTYIRYNKNYCEVCGLEKADAVYHYVGISRLGLSLIYVF